MLIAEIIYLVFCCSIFGTWHREKVWMLLLECGEIVLSSYNKEVSRLWEKVFNFVLSAVQAWGILFVSHCISFLFAQSCLYTSATKVVVSAIPCMASLEWIRWKIYHHLMWIRYQLPLRARPSCVKWCETGPGCLEGERGAFNWAFWEVGGRRSIAFFMLVESTIELLHLVATWVVDRAQNDPS